MTMEINIVDQGRGPQLSTSRITVQDLLPYLQLGYTHQQIQEVMPTLSVEEILVVTRYVEEHRELVMAEDQRIRERNASQRNSPEAEDLLRQARSERQARMEWLRKKRSEERNGEGHPC
jgi:uncharacterized protein (DUF433 family)